jgi:hypothetical protein
MLESWCSFNLCVCFSKHLPLFHTHRERERERERGSSGSWLCDFALKYSWIAIERERESEGDLGGLLLALCWWMVYFALRIGFVHDNSTLI